MRLGGRLGWVQDVLTFHVIANPEDKGYLYPARTATFLKPSL
jgi:hypothetical protein